MLSVYICRSFKINKIKKKCACACRKKWGLTKHTQKNTFWKWKIITLNPHDISSISTHNKLHPAFSASVGVK